MKYGLENIPDGVMTLGLVAPPKIQNLDFGWLKLGAIRGEHAIQELYVAPLGASVPAGGWFTYLGKRPLGEFRRMLEPAEAQADPPAATPEEATPRLAALTENDRQRVRLGSKVVYDFIRAATQPGAYQGTVTGTVVQGFQAVSQLLFSVHDRAKAEFHRELGIAADQCPVCRAGSLEFRLRSAREHLDRTEAVLAENPHAPSISRDAVLGALVEIQRTNALLTPDGQLDHWRTITETAARVMGENERPMSLADIARIYRAYQEGLTR